MLESKTDKLAAGIITVMSVIIVLLLGAYAVSVNVDMPLSLVVDNLLGVVLG